MTASRNFQLRALPAALAAGALLCFTSPWSQESLAPLTARLELTALHTGEHLTVAVSADNPMPPTAFAQLSHLLRDYRTNEQHEMDPALFGLLIELARACGCEAKYEVISGYRSPATNAQLRAGGHHVAEHSLHMAGRALDVRLRGCDLSRLRDATLHARRGGVGFYPRSNFVHVDTGRVRSWEEGVSG